MAKEMAKCDDGSREAPLFASSPVTRFFTTRNPRGHTPPGTTLRVSSAVDGGRATLTVANDGPEIPREAQQQIFERFYRLDGTRASGTGLGLAIARELAEVMGGRIELDSQNGWTLFTLVLAADAERGALAGVR